MNKDSQYVFLPTDKASEIFMDDNGKVFRSINIDQEQKHFKPQYIYILSDEEINKGDYFIDINESSKSLYPHHAGEFDYSNSPKSWKKIIATTNPELWSKKVYESDMDKPDYETIGIPPISQSDIEYIISLYNEQSKEINIQALAEQSPFCDFAEQDKQVITIYAFEGGYNKCLQDNVNKKFSLQDIEEAIEFGLQYTFSQKHVVQYNKDKNKFIQSLTQEQPKSNTVMVEYAEFTEEGHQIVTEPKPALKDGNIVIVR